MYRAADDLLAFISVESTVYAHLGEYYDARIADVLDQWDEEHREDDDDDGGDDDGGGDNGNDGAAPSPPTPAADVLVGK